MAIQARTPLTDAEREELARTLDALAARVRTQPVEDAEVTVKNGIRVAPAEESGWSPTAHREHDGSTTVTLTVRF